MQMQKFFFIAICLLCALAAQAEVYKWVDKDGLVHYSDVKPEDETIAVKEFMGSAIQIDDKGVVVQVDVKPQPQPKPQSKPEITLGSLLADAKEYFYNLLGKDAQVKPKLKPARSVASQKTDVISNDNMEEVLEQIEAEKQLKQEQEEALASQSVEIFTAPWCGYCKKAIAYLELNKVSYEEYDVTTNPTAALRQKMLGGSGGVPFAVINGEVIPGWNKQAYARALGL